MFMNVMKKQLNLFIHLRVIFNLDEKCLIMMVHMHHLLSKFFTRAEIIKTIGIFLSLYYFSEQVVCLYNGLLFKIKLPFVDDTLFEYDKTIYLLIVTNDNFYTHLFVDNVIKI